MKNAMLVLAVVGLVSLAWAADDAFIGTWKLNLAKSKGVDPSTRSEILKIEPTKNGFRWAFEIVDSSGKTIRTETSGKYDGKDNPVKGDQNIDAVASRIEGDTLVSELKKEGKVMRTGRCVVSRDGKTLTITEKEGQRTSIAVFDKQ